MAGDISVKLRADPSQFVSGVDKAIATIKDWEDAAKKGGEGASEKFEAATRAVVELGRMTGKSADETKRALEGIGYSAEDAKDAFDAVGREAKNAGDSTESVGDKAASAGEGFRSLGDVAKSALSGDIGSAADGAADAIANLLEGIPGVGLVAGVAAGGVALIGQAFQAADERRQELQDRANDLAHAYIDAGSTVLDTMTIASRVSEVLTDPAQRKEAEAYAKVIGVDVPTAARAMAGDTNVLALVQSKVNDAVSENNRLSDEQLAASGKRKSATSDAIQGNEQLIAQGNELIGVNNSATQTFNDQQRAMQGIIRDAGTATQQIDEVGNTLLTLPDGVEVLIDARTGQATFDVQKFRGDLDGNIPTVKTTTVKFKVDDSDIRNWQVPQKVGVVNYKAAQTAYGNLQ